MVHPILSTKLCAPPPQPNPVLRTRLADRLDEGLTRKLILVSAPAGFGKTTLVAEWLSRKLENETKTGAPRFAWLSLDEGDSDPVLFLAGLVAALQTVNNSLGETIVPLLNSPQPPAPRHVLGILINELMALSDPLVLVLDDYHLVDNADIHAALTYLLHHQPPCLHLVITTRVDPPLPLARLRVGRQITEIRAEDLRFTTQEAAAFLQQIWGIDLLPEHVAALDARTEGWIAGLQLAALSMERLKSHQEIAGFLRDFTGSHRYILDYLVDEVLQQQSPAVQEFLLRSSILNHLCADLCDTVLDMTGSQAMLERLEEANLFLVPLDAQRKWYRYHHLFADLLRHRLKQLQPDLAPELHQRASFWCEEHGRVDEAIAHAVACEDMERAACLIEKARWQVHGRGELATLDRWLRLLPAELVDSTGVLAMMRVWLLLNTGKMDEAERYLNRVSPILDKTSQQASDQPLAWRGEMAVLQAEIALKHGDCKQAIAFCLQARQEIPVDSLAVRSMMESMLGKAYQMCGDLEAARQAYVSATEIGARTSNHIAVLAGLCNQAALLKIQGHLHQAETMQREALAQARDRQGRAIPLAGIPHVGLGKIYREWNRLDAATEHLEEANRLGRQAGLDGLIVDATITLALVHRAQGKDAHATLRQAQEITRHWQRPLTELRMAAFAAQLWLSQDNLSHAAKWADTFMAEYGDKHAGEARDKFEIEYTILARIWLAQGKLDETQSLLCRLLPASEKAGRISRVIELLALQALTWQAQQKLDKAVATLTRALILAQPEGFVRVFVDEGRPMGELLARVAMQGSPVEASAVSTYAAHLLTAFEAPIVPTRLADPSAAAHDAPFSKKAKEGTAKADGGQHDLAQWLAEPLSERELEVLNLVADGCSNREVGQRLHISVATVKKHMENIHSKLYVSNRTQAVARARELALM